MGIIETSRQAIGLGARVAQHLRLKNRPFGTVEGASKLGAKLLFVSAPRQDRLRQSLRPVLGESGVEDLYENGAIGEAIAQHAGEAPRTLSEDEASRFIALYNQLVALQTEAVSNHASAWLARTERLLRSTVGQLGTESALGRMLSMLAQESGSTLLLEAAVTTVTASLEQRHQPRLLLSGDESVSLLRRMLGIQHLPKRLLLRAVTHPDFGHEVRGVRTNARLAHRGLDAARFPLTLMVCDRHPGASVSKVSVLRDRLTSDASMSAVGLAHGVDRTLRIGIGAEVNGLRRAPHVVTRSVRALFGAVASHYRGDPAIDARLREVAEKLFGDSLRSMD